MDVVTIDNKKGEYPYLDIDESGSVISVRGCKKIANFNFEGMCSEEKCSDKYTQVAYLTLNGVKLIIPVCDKHAGEMDEVAERYHRSLPPVKQS